MSEDSAKKGCHRAGTDFHSQRGSQWFILPVKRSPLPARLLPRVSLHTLAMHTMGCGVTLSISISRTDKIILQIKTTDRIHDVRNTIARKADIPRDQLTLKLKGIPNLFMNDSECIANYNKWDLSELDMVIDVPKGDCYVCVSRDRYSHFVLKVQTSDTIKTLKDRISTKLGYAT